MRGPKKVRKRRTDGKLLPNSQIVLLVDIFMHRVRIPRCGDCQPWTPVDTFRSETNWNLKSRKNIFVIFAMCQKLNTLCSLLSSELGLSCNKVLADPSLSWAASTKNSCDAFMARIENLNTGSLRYIGILARIQISNYRPDEETGRPSS